ncbi:stealth conserved region 3 domain-containing protein [Arthrobacter sp. SDTb3-6]|uniref:stealth conserved region 3 domain-containing protein n=1 Tax=Arthrobacter sp. SDTb3-6 TaxID=2713571 RepID=UPI00210D5F63|nr:stealth conserved region 3 domain-containing protein [Arthrobacter sp. SDTb3-6]
MLARGGVVVHKGRLALPNTTLTQEQATVADLLAVRAALDTHGIPYLLVRGNGQVPVLAVDNAFRGALQDALVRHFADEPFYARSKGTVKSTLLVADGELYGDGRARILRLFRPRLEPAGGLYFGASAGVQLELWTFGKGQLKLPRENSLTRRVVRTGDVRRGTVELHGKSWPTIEDMFASHAFDVPFPVDMVFSWVDGSSAEYQSARRAQEAGAVLGEGDAHEARFRHVDELKYALRSIYMFAPWIRTIHIATDSPAPAWLASHHPRVRLVPSAEHFADPSVLPTHNSMAVESQLHNIKGLSEYFLYSNDDMFFGRPVGPEMFFTPGGITRFMLSPNRIGLGGSSVERSGFENSARVNRKLLRERFGRVATRHLEHSAAPFRKSVMAELEAAFPEEFSATAASRFRAAGNVSVTNSLYHYYALLTGRAVMHADGKGKYVDTTTRKGLDSLDRILAKRNADFLCLNDGSFPEVGEAERRARLTDFLERYFPLKAPWER